MKEIDVKISYEGFDEGTYLKTDKKRLQ